MSANGKTAGCLEIFGAMGLIFPQLWNIAPIFTPLPSLGCSMIILLAAIGHQKKERPKTSLSMSF
ncbi:MAG: DoxX family protein [Sphingomonadales bacterium]|jgi:hypothetical protein